VASLILTTLLLTGLPTIARSADPEAVSLQTRRSVGDILAVRTVLEVEGQLKINPDGKKVRRLPLKVHGDLVFDERLVSTGDEKEQPRQAVRYYREAQAKVTVAGRDSQSQLSDDRRFIAVEQSGGKLTLYSPLGPLSRQGLDLIDVQGPHWLLEQMLPASEVRLDDTWRPHKDVVAQFFRLDAVGSSTVQGELKEVNEHLARVEFHGVLTGAAGGVATDIEVTAKVKFDRRERRITWMALGIKEDRSIGHAAPGLVVSARIRSTFQPRSRSEVLSPAALAQLQTGLHEGATLLEHVSAGRRFRLLHDRRWHVMVDQPNLTVLRLVDGGELVAQCNITRTADRKATEREPLAAFRRDIREKLGDRFGKYQASTTVTTDQGVTMDRLVIDGVQGMLPIRWIYFRLTDAEGRRAVAVITLENSLIKTFGVADQKLLGGFSFLEPKPVRTSQRSRKNDRRR